MHGNVLRSIQHCKFILLSVIMKHTKSSVSEIFLRELILFGYFIAESKNRYSSLKSKEKKNNKNLVQNSPSAILGIRGPFFIGAAVQQH